MKLKNLSIEHLWVLVILGLCFSYLCTHPIDQYDFWQHLKDGETIYNTKAIPTVDTATFTVYGKHYVDISWGAQLIYYLLYKIGQLQLLVFSHAIIVTLAYFFLFKIALRISNNLRVAAIATLIAMAPAVTNLALRPQAFSILFFSLTFYLLKTKRYVWIPGIFLLWANFHGAFVMGLLLIGAHLFEDINYKKRVYINSKALVTLICAMIFTLINPVGWALYSGVLNLTAVPTGIHQIMEWLPPSLQNDTGIVFFPILLLLLILQIWKKPRWTVTEIITFTVFIIFAFKWQRAVIWWAMITVPIFAKLLQTIFPVRTEQPLSKRINCINVIFAMVLIGYFVSCVPWLKVGNPLVPQEKQYLIAPNTPVALANKLRTLAHSKRIFNNYSWAAYFTWSLRTDQKLFVDPKDVLYTPAFIKELYVVNNAELGYEKILNQYGVDTLAIDKETQLPLIQSIEKSSRWKKVYEDELGDIFVRS